MTIKNVVLAAATVLPTVALAASVGSFDYSALSLREVGARNTKVRKSGVEWVRENSSNGVLYEWRMWLEQNGDPISFWHDVPTWPDESDKQIINVVIEVPRWQDGKIELARDEPLNPIYHDTRNGAPRFVESVWPHKSYPFLYGSIPQTWESPNYEHEFTGFEGDNDPVDLFDIGQDPGYVGQVKQVKILGALALADGNETDWKVMGIDIKDPLAALVDSWEDVEEYRPGTAQTFRDWWTYYKVARGDEVIDIVGDWYQNVTFMKSVLEESHRTWEELIKGQVDSNEINYNQTSRSDVSKSFIKKSSTTKKFDLPKKSKIEPAVAKPEAYSGWWYLDSNYTLLQVPQLPQMMLNRQSA